MPAEWERHHATWIGWPHNASDWPGRLGPIPWVYAEIVRKLAPGEIVRILVNSGPHQRKARSVLERAGVDLGRVEFFRFPTNRGWTRDFGPLFVRRPSPRADVAIARFRFNAWAKYPDWKKDDRIPERVAARLKLPLVPARVVLEGVLRDYLGVTHVLWLGEGIAGDDTHGHVDDVCRFVNTGTVVLCRESDPRDVNYRPLAENRERLEDMRLEDGSKIAVVDLPMPAPLYFAGQRLPASYANFYIANAAALVPTFNDPPDRVALGILGELFRDRPVVGIHAVDLVWGLGTIHCLTQQEPFAGGGSGERRSALTRRHS